MPALDFSLQGEHDGNRKISSQEEEEEIDDLKPTYRRESIREEGTGRAVQNDRLKRHTRFK